jgi:hypothetical protein
LRIVHERDGGGSQPAQPDQRVLADLAGDLKRRLATAASRNERLERQFEACRTALKAERSARADSEKQNKLLQAELEEIEASVAGAAKLGETNLQLPALSNLTLLYVGGRQAQLGTPSRICQRSGAALLHHDGGIDERGGILQGLISRADVVLFPVDCVSHTAMLLAKRLCRQYGKPILPLAQRRTRVVLRRIETDRSANIVLVSRAGPLIFIGITLAADSSPRNGARPAVPVRFRDNQRRR